MALTVITSGKHWYRLLAAIPLAVQRVANEHLHPESMVVVAVGEAEQNRKRTKQVEPGPRSGPIQSDTRKQFERGAFLAQE